MERKFSSLPQLTVLNKFILARWCYSVGEPVISDAEYTILSNAVKTVLPGNEYCHRSWSSDPCPVELLKQVGWDDLIRKVLLTDKTESIPSLNSELEVMSVLGTFTGDGTISMKHDGWNVQSHYYNGDLVSVNTRGRKTDAVQVGAVAMIIPKKIPVMGAVRIVGELTVNLQNFATCVKLWKNVSPRAAVSSVLANPDYINLLDYHAFDVSGCDTGENKFETLKSWGFQIPKYFIVHNYPELLQGFKELSDAKEGYLSPTDGAVFDAPGLRRAIRLLAWEEPIYKSFVTGYHEQFKSYRISPSVKIHPILRNGTTQRKINMTNWQRILDYDLEPGSPVAFRIASSATADFDEEATRLLRVEWLGRWEEYAEMIKRDEEVKQVEWQQLLH